MEEIIGLLVIVAIAIFKGVSKKLEQSGTNPSAPVRPTTANEPEAKPQVVRKAVEKPVEEPVKQKEKIDPKKLIIYSEIMNPKCNE